MTTQQWLVAVGHCTGLFDTETAACASAGAHPMRLIVPWNVGSEDDKQSALEFAHRCTHGCVVYTDGACTSNGRAGAHAGVGVFWGAGDPRNVSRPVKGSPTNNVAELEAIEDALQCVKDTVAPSCAVTVVSDTLYGIQCLTTWFPNFVRRNWLTVAGTPVKNRELIERTRALLDVLPNVQLFHVRGHRGIVGNEAADALASAAIRPPPTNVGSGTSGVVPKVSRKRDRADTHAASSGGGSASGGADDGSSNWPLTSAFDATPVRTIRAGKTRIRATTSKVNKTRKASATK